MSDRDADVRSTTAANAGRGAEALLTSALASDPHARVRHAAARTLGLLGGEEAASALVAAALDDEDAVVRATALPLVGEELGRGTLVERLRGELASGSARRRQMALRALAKLSARLTSTEAAAMTPIPMCA